MTEKLKIMVVDDDRQMVKTICDILRVNGFEAACAFSGEEAVEKLREAGADCVLMDLKMPGIDGVETLRRIREFYPALPVVLMSAYATEEQLIEAKRQGAETILTKPVDIQLVLSFLHFLRKEESVLIVDDDPAFCRTLREILQARGYRVETEVDAGNVLGRMEEDHGLVILDLKLGNANGVAILGEIRTRYPAKPVVLVTGYREEAAGAIEKGLQIGAYTCLYKPFEAEELLRIIEEISRRQPIAFPGEPS
jgi:DNA-binding response OmpR family regulator